METKLLKHPRGVILGPVPWSKGWKLVEEPNVGILMIVQIAERLAKELREENWLNDG
ncbi:hypothetical protein MBM_04198 [Drepanopeziza brunnea f. sp. 'multigermtubi' MB_m1]|uniref:Uncharacterized protein n=1 Tax=Marssonina brunnea f. sp. multigermtubi (strain MB_m1) TaxID=1072389 RepID=K1XYC9_MARBU|nr:uncharacterized protein MBM_04198 [Drepanopeziza brunnea f. sp. 'multigermtubi' MB_m1]EKD17829.1 hypothetical protein MBM_04198 [Drepanopeziza brunnea f. sp. 'multigermtubi' MB_m1]